MRRSGQNSLSLFNESVSNKEIEESEQEFQGSSSSSIQLLKLPHFVVNIPMYVPVDSDNESDDDSDDNEEHKFENSQFEHPPFSINNEKRGIIELPLNISDIKKMSEVESKIQRKILDNLDSTGFYRDESQLDKSKRLSISIGFNRPRSLSKRKNKFLENELTLGVQKSPFVIKTFGFFWNYNWRRIYTIEKIILVPYQEEIAMGDRKKNVILLTPTHENKKGFKAYFWVNGKRALPKIIKSKEIKNTSEFTKVMKNFHADKRIVIKRTSHERFVDTIATKLGCTFEVQYKKVRSFYKQFKRYNKIKARTFRRKNENHDTSNRMVPYRHIRESVKNHVNTQELIREARKEPLISDVYLSFIDGDTVSFCHPEKLGIYTVYTNEYLNRTPRPDVMSTGYEYDIGDNDPLIIRFASTLDMRVRAVTSEYIQNGIYYPEPNVCIRVLSDKDSIKESFLGTKKEVEYESPSEAVLILKEVAKRLGFTTFFSRGNPLLTKVPPRAKKNKSGALITSNATIKDSKFHDWSWSDVVNVTRNVAQSHARGRDWAIHLLHQYECKGSVKLSTSGDKNIHVTKYVRNIAISLLSRLFNSYDPVSIAENKAGENKEIFMDVLLDYESLIEPENIPEGNEGKARKGKTNKAAWKMIDSYNTRTQVKNGLQAVLECKSTDIEAIENAAKAAGEAISKTFFDFFHIHRLLGQVSSVQLDLNSLNAIGMSKQQIKGLKKLSENPNSNEYGQTLVDVMTRLLFSALDDNKPTGIRPILSKPELLWDEQEKSAGFQRQRRNSQIPFNFISSTPIGSTSSSSHQPTLISSSDSISSSSSLTSPNSSSLFASSSSSSSSSTSSTQTSFSSKDKGFG